MRDWPCSRMGKSIGNDSSAVRKISNIETVFSCTDLDGKVAMVPNSPCPVLWGFRGTNKDKLIQNFDKLGPEIPSRWLLYKTNQATDDHLRSKEISKIKDGDSVNIEVSVTSKSTIIKGGHRFFEVQDKFNQTTNCAAFEPTKNFRHIVDKLEIGDLLIICGSVNNGTINLEKLRILELVPRFLKPENPICVCGQRTHSSGKESYYRCKSCSKKYDRPEKVVASSGLELKSVSKELWEKSQKQYDAFFPGPNEWPALLRRCDAIDSSYKE